MSKQTGFEYTKQVIEYVVQKKIGGEWHDDLICEYDEARSRAWYLHKYEDFEDICILRRETITTVTETQVYGLTPPPPPPRSPETGGG